jgi:hypothetical protein
VSICHSSPTGRKSSSTVKPKLRAI